MHVLITEWLLNQCLEISQNKKCEKIIIIADRYSQWSVNSLAEQYSQCFVNTLADRYRQYSVNSLADRYQPVISK